MSVGIFDAANEVLGRLSKDRFGVSLPLAVLKNRSPRAEINLGFRTWFCFEASEPDGPSGLELSRESSNAVVASFEAVHRKILEDPLRRKPHVQTLHDAITIGRAITSRRLRPGGALAGVEFADFKHLATVSQ